MTVHGGTFHGFVYLGPSWTSKHGGFAKVSLTQTASHLLVDCIHMRSFRLPYESQACQSMRTASKPALPAQCTVYVAPSLLLYIHWILVKS